MTNVFVRPARPDMKIAVPNSTPRRYLKAEGEEVPANNYWLRMLRRQDVLEGAAQKPDPTPKAKKEAKA